jgi:hypothetical protein
VTAEFGGRVGDLRRRAAGVAGGAIDAGDVGGDVLDAARGFLDVAGDFLRGGALFLDGGGDRHGDTVDLADGTADVANRLDGIAGHVLDRRDLRGDVLGRFRGLVGEALDLAGDDGETLAGLAGTRRLDGGVERQQIGLRGDGLNHLDDLADPVRRVDQPAHGRVGALRLVHGFAGHHRRLLDMPADLSDRVRQLFGGDGDRLDIGRHLLRGSEHRRRLAAGLLGGDGHARRRGVHARGCAGERFEHAPRRPIELGNCFRHNLLPALSVGLVQLLRLRQPLLLGGVVLENGQSSS